MPPLRLRKDIWETFPVNLDAVEKAVDGADQYGIEWHNMKVRRIAQAERKTVEQVQRELLPQIMDALHASRAWIVIPAPSARFFTGIAMRFAHAATRKSPNKAKSPNNVTRKSPNKPKSANKAVKAPTPNKPKSANTAKNKPASVNKTRKVQSLLKKAAGILNKITDTTADRLIHEFVAMEPANEEEYENLIALIMDRTIDQLNQIQHPNMILLLHAMDARHKVSPYPTKPSKALVRLFLKRAKKEPIYVDLLIESDESSSPNALEQKAVIEKLKFRATMLFIGYMYRDGFLSISKLSKVLNRLKEGVEDADADYRNQDACAMGLMFVLIRAGAQMEEEDPETFAKYHTFITHLSTTYPRGAVKNVALEFLDAVKHKYLVKEGAQWYFGAPGKKRMAFASQMYGKVAAAEVVAPAPAAVPNARIGRAQAAEKLGADISPLYKRFPVVVNQEGSMYIVRIHNKKLSERFAAEGGRFASQEELKASLIHHMKSMVDNSDHWKQGPAIPGAVMSVVAK